MNLFFASLFVISTMAISQQGGAGGQGGGNGGPACHGIPDSVFTLQPSVFSAENLTHTTSQAGSTLTYIGQQSQDEAEAGITYNLTEEQHQCHEQTWKLHKINGSYSVSTLDSTENGITTSTVFTGLNDQVFDLTGGLKTGIKTDSLITEKKKGALWVSKETSTESAYFEKTSNLEDQLRTSSDVVEVDTYRNEGDANDGEIEESFQMAFVELNNSLLGGIDAREHTNHCIDNFDAAGKILERQHYLYETWNQVTAVPNQPFVKNGYGGFFKYFPNTDRNLIDQNRKEIQIFKMADDANGIPDVSEVIIKVVFNADGSVSTFEFNGAALNAPYSDHEAAITQKLGEIATWRSEFTGYNKWSVYVNRSIDIFPKTFGELLGLGGGNAGGN